MVSAQSALIIGGGIAGLAAAIALARAGVGCEVVELADAPLGASLGISGRAAEALADLGVYDECYATGTPWTRETTAAHLMDATGKLISTGPQRPDWPGAKTAIGVYRPVFLTILADEARRLGATLRHGITARAIDADTGAVEFTDGTHGSYDLIVGADGIGSPTRVMVFPDAPAPAYSGQMSIRWMVEGPPIDGEGWYVGPVGRIGFYHLPQGLTYAPAVITSAEWRRRSPEEVLALFTDLLDSYTAPAIVELRRRLTADADLICRPFEWLLVAPPWYRGRVLLIGDAAHATTAHLGMGGGMALEDAVVLGECIAAATSLGDALAAFTARRYDRVRTVVETSVDLSRLEQAKAPSSENVALIGAALRAIAAPY